MLLGKYRVWDNENNEYFEPTYEAHKGNLKELFLTPSGRLILCENGQKIDQSCFPKRFVVEFSLGMPDIDGADIYEGDVLQWCDTTNVKDKWVVKFTQGGWEPFIPDCTTSKPYRYKIIGNMNKNPELEVCNA